MKPFLSLQRLACTLGAFRLGPLSLELAKTDYLVLLGSTGSGKSSLLQTIAGMQGTIPHAIYLDSIDIGLLPPHRRHLGYVLQGNNLFPHLTVKGNLAFGLRYLSLTRKMVEFRLQRMLELFGLQNQAHQPVATLSGGEQRKAAMGRSLLIEPKLLLLDEPLSMLDHNARQEISALLKRIHLELKITTIHVTHDRLEAWNIADRCAIMKSGRILQIGQVDEVFRKPQHYFVADFLGAENIFAADWHGQTASTLWGQVRLQHPVRPSHGFIVIRPEHISLSPVKSSAKIKGQLRELRDFGQYFEAKILVKNACVFTAHIPAYGGTKLKLRTQVYLAWQNEHVHIIPSTEPDKNTTPGDRSQPDLCQ